MALLVDSSMIGYLIASERNVSLLRRIAKSSSFVYTWKWSEMCWTWSRASCSNTALNAPHIAVTSCVGWRRAAPAFHCRSDNLHCAWRRSLTSSVMTPSKPGLDFTKRGEWNHPRWRVWEDLVPGVAGHRRCVRGLIRSALRGLSVTAAWWAWLKT